jgi:hypothetical protein
MRFCKHDAMDSLTQGHRPTVWQRKLDLSVLDDDRLDPEAIAHAVIKTLRQHHHVFSYGGVPALIERLEEAALAQNWEAFDHELDTLFDIADDERVWLG